MILPDINPVLITLGPLSVNFYSLSYVFGFIIGSHYIAWICRRYSIEFKNLDDLTFYLVLSVVIGGRLGYVIFYGFEHYLQNPLDIIKTYEGGMSFHGGLVGVTLGCYIFAKKYNKKFLMITDLISCAAPIGIFLGRVANFFNRELYGRYTSMPWGVVFSSGEGPRHPTQLYEAFCEGLIIFIIQNNKLSYIKNSGALTANFLILYSIFRILIEFLREPDAHIGFLYGYFTMGQLISIPTLILGIYVYKICKN